jgi:hypothetical protein
MTPTDEATFIALWQEGLSHEALAQQLQTTSKFPFHWWGMNSTLSSRHQLNRPPGPHRVEGEALDVSVSGDENPQVYADSTRSASFPTDGNKIMTRFAISTYLLPVLYALLNQST